MYKLRLVVLTCATAALLALVAASASRADPRTNYCNVQNLWAASVSGGALSNGVVLFNIFNQTPPAPSNDDGSEAFALASQLATQVALGLGNAGEGDKYHFRVETVQVSSGATARGHGFLFVPDSGLATFVIAGKGTHPLGGPGMTPGSFKMSGGGDVECVAEEGTLAQAFVDVAYENGITDEDVVVNMARCPAESEGCDPPGGGGGD